MVQPVNLILDTDLGPDYDDVGAMALMHALADSGQVNILATVSSNKNEHVVPCIEVLNTYFNRPDIPVGAPKSEGGASLTTWHKTKWTEELPARYPHETAKTSDAPDAVKVYRRILSTQPDSSVVVCTIGFFTNLKDLLLSGGDEYSPLSGRDLVAKKVKRVVSMAGLFPEGKEFNVYCDTPASRVVAEQWPTEIIFSGFEIGNVIFTGKKLVQMDVKGSPVTFLDTPGHEAFTGMRARGAMITDVAILVVAADDGIMPQTVESINHAKAANVKIIVAMNKMDKPTANPERVMEGLTKYGIITEDWGGDVACIPVSALTGMGINDLLERIALEAEVMELKANPNRRAKGAVVEARLDKGQGPIATILVQNGTLHAGDVIIAGTAVGRVRTMRSDKGMLLNDAGPSTPVEITGLTAVPEAGDLFEAVADERLARELAEQRIAAAKEKQFSSFQKVTLDNLFSQMAQNDMKELAIVVKADVQGSAEAVKQSLEKISNDEVRVRVIHAGVGAISKSDVDLADASNAIIIGFNVRPDNVAKEEAAATKVEMRMYRVIYDAINDVTDAMKGMLAPKFREISLGELQVRQVYKISNVGTVAGCRVTSGKITRDSQVRVVRDGIVIAEDEIASLKRFKDDAKEVAEGYECGVTLEKFADVKEGDVYEAFKMEEYRD